MKLVFCFKGKVKDLMDEIKKSLDDSDDLEFFGIIPMKRENIK